MNPAGVETGILIDDCIGRQRGQVQNEFQNEIDVETI